VDNSKKLFELYQKKNPNGKIIFLSSAGDLHRDNNGEYPKPHSLYGKSKLQVEEILSIIDCQTTIFRVTNIWGGIVEKNRVNGLVDKLLTLIDTDEVVEIYANLKTTVDIIHVDDIVKLILKAISRKTAEKNETFLVGAQNISIYDIINIVSMRGTLNLKINQKAEKSYLNINTTKVKETFDWEPKLFLK
jgi:nucleoside-diphosphate-sugar epimerase